MCKPVSYFLNNVHGTVLDVTPTHGYLTFY